MSSASKPSQASFNCKFCQKPIFIPLGLPPTTAPCPHCGEKVTSPDQQMAEKKAAPAPMPTEAQAVRLEPEKDKEASVGSAASSGRSAPPRAAAAGGLRPEEAQVEPEPEKKKSGSQVGVILAAVVILLLAAGVTLWLSEHWKSEKESGGGAGPDVTTIKDVDPKKNREAWLNGGWRAEASKVLEAFTEASNPEERAKYVIPNEGVLEELKMYYPPGKKDTIASAQSFSHVVGAREDLERGIFLMQYRQPAQIDMREYFAPIGSLEAVLGQQETTLLEMAHRIDEDNLSDPIGINAFFKEIDGELKLDASVFIQGRYRTFKLFTSYPQPGKSQVFRTVVSEALTHHYRNNSDIRTYRFEDFAYPGDFVTLPVGVDSKEGKVLSQLNWHGLKKGRVYRTATVELGWTEESPSELEVKRIICWEFLGVGGEEGNTEQKVEADAGTEAEPAAPASEEPASEASAAPATPESSEE